MDWIDDLDNLMFYKYRSDLDESDRDLDIIKNSEVWFDTPKNFNDPFDCSPKPSVRTREQAIAVIERSINGKSLTDETRHQIEASYSENSESVIESVRYGSATPEYVQQFMSQYLVFSLAKNPLIRLMWSHYASNHSGFAIEFDLMPITMQEMATGNRESIENSFLPMPVEYKNERPEIHEENSDRSSLPLFVKDKIWSYEAEYRMLRQGEPSLVGFDPIALSAIILGARVTEATKSKIQDTVFEVNRTRGNKIAIYYAELSEKTFDLHIPGHPYYENK